jgi:hypothetical protein
MDSKILLPSKAGTLNMKKKERKKRKERKEKDLITEATVRKRNDVKRSHFTG